MSIEILWGELVAGLLVAAGNQARLTEAPIRAAFRVGSIFIAVRAAVALLIYYI